MTDKELRVIDGDRETLEQQKAEEIIKALLMDKDRETAYKIANELKPRGASILSIIKTH